MTRAAKPHRDRTDTVTTADLLASQLQGQKPREVGTRCLTVGGVPVAKVSTDVVRLNPITATSSTEMPALEMIAALSGHDPTGIMLVEDANGTGGFAFNVEKGRVTGARGSGDLDDLKLWAKELYARFPDRVTTPPPGEAAEPGNEWVGIAKDFVREHALDSLEYSTTPGTRITLLRGDISWQGPSLPGGGGLGLQHLLLEHARRHDELPRMMKKLGDLRQLALPMYEPGPMPPGGKPTPTGDAEDWGDAQPDTASQAAWDLARAVYHLCDGQRSIDELADYSMFGRFRTLEALALLAKSQCVIVVEPPNRNAAGPNLLQLPTPAKPSFNEGPTKVATNVAPKPAPMEHRPTTGYMLARRAKERIDVPSKPTHKPRPKPTTPAASRPRPEVRAPAPLRPTARPKATPPPMPPVPGAQTERIPTRTLVEAHADVVTAKPPSVRDANVGGGRALLEALEAELATLDVDAKPETSPKETSGGIPWNFVLLAVLGSLLFAGGAAFSMMLG
ncbi:MAG: hypothetical protein ACE37F_21140 [Nannocystaceae bacterium]|nr:hypothetical protein [bacterium]